MKVLDVESSRLPLLENSMTITFFVYCVDSACCSVGLRCVFVIYLFHTHTDVVVGLLITSSPYLSV